MAQQKKSQMDDYRSLSDEALDDRIEELSVQLKRYEFSHAVNPLENPMVIRRTRRDIARLKTEQRKRELTPEQ